MYGLLHSEIIESEPIHGIVFMAQLIGGKLRFGAKLATPIGQHKNTFPLWDHEWDNENAYILNVGPLYRRTSKTEAVETWIENEVYPWMWNQKRAYLLNSIDKAEEHIKLQKQALVDLERTIEQKESNNG